MATVSNGSKYDFIFGGGGTAGNAVTGRLAADPDVGILVVEAGIPSPDDIEQITTPSKTFTLRGSKYDWPTRRP